MKRSIGVLIILLTTVCNSGQPLTGFPEPDAVITGDYVRVRTEPSLKAPVIDYLFKGNVTGILEKVNGDSYNGNSKWVEVSSFQFAGGYVHSDYIIEGKEAEVYKKQLPASVHDSLLRQDFSPDAVKAVESYRKAYTAATTAEELVSVYLQTEKTAQKLRPVIQRQHDRNMDGNCRQPCILKFNYLMNYIPAGTISIAAEGTAAFLHTVPELFYHKALTTEGKYDDLYFDLESYYYGIQDRLWPAYTERTWDYGGHSLLGQGIHLTILKKADTVLKTGSLLDREVHDMRSRTLKDIEDYNIYYEDSEAIITELKKILESAELSGEEKAMLKRRIIQFKDPESFGISLNCKKENCPYG